MEIKDLKEETRIKISFPDESEIEEEWQRIMLTTHHLMEYLLDLGLDPSEIYRTIMYMGLKRYLTVSKDLENARQEAQIYFDATLDNELMERKKIQESSGEHADFFFYFYRFKDAIHSTINLCILIFSSIR